MIEDETTETSTSGCGERPDHLLLLRVFQFQVIIKLNFFSGSLILEMGMLSRLTGDTRYEAAALRALRKLWSMRSSLNLLGTTLDVITGEWIEYSSGIGAGTFSCCTDQYLALSEA